jgi:hypothetical protein
MLIGLANFPFEFVLKAVFSACHHNDQALDEGCGWVGQFRDDCFIRSLVPFQMDGRKPRPSTVMASEMAVICK